MCCGDVWRRRQHNVVDGQIAVQQLESVVEQIENVQLAGGRYDGVYGECGTEK